MNQIPQAWIDEVRDWGKTVYPEPEIEQGELTAEEWEELRRSYDWD